jgi:hypothetical protein
MFMNMRCVALRETGKTHTMLGTKADPGVAPRVVAQLFAEMEARSSTLFAVQMTYIELYNDEFIDLLDPDNQPDKLAQLHVQARTATPHRRPKIELHARQGGGIDLVGSTTLRTSVCSAAEALKLLYAGRRARHTAQTQLNGIFHTRSTVFCYYFIFAQNVAVLLLLLLFFK